LLAYHFLEQAESPGALGFDYATCIWWTLDMFICTRTAFFRDSVLVTDTRLAFRNYAKTWLSLDCLMLSFDWICMFHWERHGKLLRTSQLLRVIRIVRLFRLVKFPMLSYIIEVQLTSSKSVMLFRLCKFTVALLVLVHAAGCGWYAVGCMSNDGWVAHYSNTNTAIRTDDMLYWYLASSRWTLAQLNGRTDTNEMRTSMELLYTSFMALCLAVIIMSVYVSAITSTMVELNALQESSSKIRKRVNDYLVENSVDVAMAETVRLQVKDIDSGTDFAAKEQQVVSLLPTQLGYDLLTEVRRPTILRHTLFYNINSAYPRVVRILCHRVLSVIPVATSEAVFDKGDPCSRILFVHQGYMVYSQTCPSSTLATEEDFVRPVRIQRGKWVAEAALWVEWANQGKFSGDSPSVLLGLEASDLANLMLDYRDIHLMTSLYAAAFLLELRKETRLSDLFIGKV